MKILITGANGFVGSALCREGLRQGYEVLALVRPGTNRELVPLEAREVYGQFQDRATMRALLQEHRPHAILHAAAIVSSGTPDLEASLRINVEGTKSLLRESAVAGVSRWLQVSSMSAHCENLSVYGHTKLLADEAVRTGGIPWTIFRPSLVYGPQRRGIFYRMTRLVRRLPLVPMLGFGGEPMSPIHVDDVAAVFLEALKNPQAVGKTYEIGGPEQWTLRAMLSHMRKAMGRRPLLMPVPLPFCRMAALAGELCLPSPPFTLDNLEGVSKAKPVDSKPAQSELGFAARSFKEGFADCLTSFLEDQRDGRGQL